MNRPVWMLLLAGLSAFSGSGCGSARKARKARKIEAVRRADSIAAVQGTGDAKAVSVDTGHAVPSADTIETAALDPSKSSVPSYILSLHGRSTPFQTFSGKTRVAYESGEDSKEFTAVFRIRRDSAIWVSVVAAGGLVPVARILITPDSVQYVNYLMREASRMPIEEAAHLLPLPAQFSQLQALLLGDVLEPEAAIISTGKAEGTGLYFVATTHRLTDYTAYYTAADSLLTAESARANAGELELELLYKEYEPVAGRRFARERELRIRRRMPVGDENTLIRLHFTDPPRFDIPLEFSFSIPKNYTLK